MATGTAGDAGHRLPWGVKHVISKRVLYSDWTSTNNDRHNWGVLPAYALVTGGATCDASIAVHAWVEYAQN